MTGLTSYRDFMTRGAKQQAKDQHFARGLGWVSLAIGAAELLMPRQIERFMGIGNGKHTGVIRVLGVREVMHGVDLLSHRDPTPGVWSRVAGDVLDGALLGAAATKTRRPMGFAMIAALVLPVVVADLLLAPRVSQQQQWQRRRFWPF